MNSVASKAAAILKGAFLGLILLFFGAGAWAALVQANLAHAPSVPWSAPVMAVFLWILWRYLGGAFWPRGSSEARRALLRANPAPPRVFAWSALAGGLAVISLAGLWIVLFQLVQMPLNALSDLSHYSRFTVVTLIGMSAIAAPLTEEPAFRGYCQVILERQFSPPAAIVLSSLFFAIAHGPTQGFVWPKLLFYFLVGVAFGTIAYLTRSILPAIPAHVFGLLVFFTLIWPNDPTRRLVADCGADRWFWIHTGQAIVFAVLAVWAFRKLAAVRRQGDS
jgi:membrane protease YdiL (CAAX protease family)